MAKGDFLDDLDEVVEGADLQFPKKQDIDTSGTKVETKMKNLRIAVDWENRIKSFYGGTVTGYIVMAIKNQMKKDGIL